MAQRKPHKTQKKKCSLHFTVSHTERGEPPSPNPSPRCQPPPEGGPAPGRLAASQGPGVGRDGLQGEPPVPPGVGPQRHGRAQRRVPQEAAPGGRPQDPAWADSTQRAAREV